MTEIITGEAQKGTDKTTPSQQRKDPLGFVNFDGSSGDNSLVDVRVPQDRIERIRRGQYVLLIESKGGDSYLGRVTKGPFYNPDAVGRDSGFAKASILMGDKVKFLPDYHAVCMVEILGSVYLDTLSLSGHTTRPLPKTFVWELDENKIEELLNLRGNMYLGHLAGYEGVRVHFQAGDKRVLPRNVGIFGTVGSGKTNTSQVLIEEASAAGYAVAVLDVEGEYVSMDRSSEELSVSPRLREAASRFGISPRGIDSLRVYRVTGTESKRKDAIEFCIKFGDISPYTLCEIMGLNEAQEHRFLELYDTAVESVRSGKQQPGAKSKWDRLKGGEAVVGLDRIPELTLQLLIDKLRTDFLTGSKGADRSSWLKVNQLLHKLKRYQIFDTHEQGLNVNDLLTPGRVSIFDLSDSTNTRINNIVIADILRRVFDHKLNNEDAPPTLIMIEEAHTFVSRENVSKMEFTVDQLREISRRGRKRWLGLCFISQQPAHLPDELYELCNTKIIHQTTGKKNLDALRTSAGNVNEAVWSEVPILGQGRSVIISPQFTHPVLCDMRPCQTHREYTD